MPVGEVVWDICMALSINCHHSLICSGNMLENKNRLSLCLCLSIASWFAGFCHWQSRRGVGVPELCTNFLVIVWLSPNTLSFIPARACPFTGPFCVSLEGTVNLVYNFQVVLRKQNFSFPQTQKWHKIT